MNPDDLISITPMAAEVHDDDNHAGFGTCRCGARWWGHAICHCGACHMTFTSVGPFDKHRFRGRCRTADEMQKLGYEPNEREQWRKPRPEESIPGHD